MTSEALKRVERILDRVHQHGDGETKARREALKIIRAALSEPEWTAVEDMPPEWKDGRPVLAIWTNQFGQWIGILHDQDGLWHRGEDGETLSEANTVTHVRLPPAPPKGETE